MMTSISRHRDPSAPSLDNQQYENNIKSCSKSRTRKDRTGKSLPTSPKISNNSYKDETSYLLLNATEILTGTTKESDDDLDIGKRFQGKKTNKTLASGSSPYRYRDGTSIGSDLCPRDWFKVRSGHNTGQRCDHSCCGRWFWKFCFLCCCLPVCYPCYLTRTYRHRWKHSSRLRPDLKSKSCPNLVTSGQEFDVSMSRQASGHSQSQCRLQGYSKSESVRVIEERKKKAEDLIELDVMILNSSTAMDLTEKLAELSFLTLDECGIKTKMIIQAKKGAANVIDKLQRNQQETGIVKLKSIIGENLGIGDNSPVLLRKVGKGHVSNRRRDQKLNIGSLERHGDEQSLIVEKDVEDENIFKIPDVPPRPSTEKLDDNDEDVSTPGSFYSGGCISVTETPRHGPLPSYGSITSGVNDVFFSIESGIDKLFSFSKASEYHQAISESPSIASARSLRYPPSCASSGDRRFERYYSSMSTGEVGRRAEIYPLLLSHRSYDSSQPSTDRSDRYYSCNSSLYSHRAEETLKGAEVLQNTPIQPCQVAEYELRAENMKRVKSNISFTTKTCNSPEKQFLETHFGPDSIELNINKDEVGDNGTSDGTNPSKEVDSIPAIKVELAGEMKGCHKSEFFNMKRLGWRREEVAGINVKLNLMTEPDLTSWKICDIKEFATTQLPSLDIIVIVWRMEEELKVMLDKETGVLSYIRKYWTGFFLFLLVEVQPDPLAADDLLDPTVNKEQKKEDNPSSLDMFSNARSLFGDCHRIVIHESDLASGNLSFVTESMARFFSHSKLFNCTRFGGRGMENLSLINPGWICPDLCQLRTTAPQVEIRKKVRRRFFNSFRWKGTSRRVGEGATMQIKKHGTRSPREPQDNNLEFEEDKSSSFLSESRETPPSLLSNGIDNSIKEKKPLKSFLEVEEEVGQ